MAVREEVIFHPEVFTDLTQIWQYIADDSIESADRVIGEILTAIRRLVSFPSQGHTRPDITTRPLRFYLVRDYMIVYAAGELPIYVVAVAHGMRNPRTIATLLRDRP